MAIIKGTAGNDNTLVGSGADDKIYGYGGEDTLDGGDGNDALYAGAGNDTLIGGAGNDQLSGDLGADTMYGGTGNDTYYVDDVGDAVIEYAGEGIDLVVSTISFDLRDTPFVENLTLSGLDDINAKGNALDNTIKGNDGNNSISGGDGNDNIIAGGGNDIVSGGAGNDYLVGGDGVDLLTYKVGTTSGVTVSLDTTAKQNTGGAGIDSISGFENLEGTFFNDRLTGSSGDNKIAGLSGDDWIRGLAGNDDITAGADADTIHFERAGVDNGVDRIRGFQTGVDKLEFSAADGFSAGAGFTVGKTAVGSGAQFVWDNTLDLLSYDADGDGAGAAVLLASFASLKPDATADVRASDITIIA